MIYRTYANECTMNLAGRHSLNRMGYCVYCDRYIGW